MSEPAQIPPTLDTPEFREAWREYIAHRRDLRHRLTPRSARMQLRKLAAIGPERAVAAIEHSIANGYRGIFEPPQAAAAAPQRKKPMSLWEIKEREKALLEELESVSKNHYGQDADRVNAERAERRKQIRAKLRELREAKLNLDG